MWGQIPPPKLSEQASHLLLLLRAISILGDKSFHVAFYQLPFVCFSNNSRQRASQRNTPQNPGQTSFSKDRNNFAVTKMWNAYGAHRWMLW